MTAWGRGHAVQQQVRDPDNCPDVVQPMSQDQCRAGRYYNLPGAGTSTSTVPGTHPGRPLCCLQRRGTDPAIKGRRHHIPVQSNMV